MARRLPWIISGLSYMFPDTTLAGCAFSIIRTKTALALLVVFFTAATLAGCTPAAETVTSMHAVGPVPAYSALQVQPVTNDTGNASASDPAAALTEKISAELQERGYRVLNGNQAPSDALIVKCSLVSYQAGDPMRAWLTVQGGQAQATVKTILIDKKSGRVLATMLTPASFAAGLYGYAIPPDQYVLNSVAKGIANEIDARVKNS